MERQKGVARGAAERERHVDAMRAVRLVVVLVVTVVVFLVSLTLVYTLPQEPIRKHVGAAVLLQRSEGPYPAAPLPYEGFMLDGFTDAICLDHALAEPGNSPLTSALASVNNDPDAFEGDTIAALADSVIGKRKSPVSYWSYWHGYLVTLRPALLLFDYYQIRYINFLLLSILGTTVVLQIGGLLGPKAAAAFALSFALAGFWTAPASLQYATMMYVSLLSTLVVCLALRRRVLDRYALEFFMLFGAFTAFFDFLTVPLLSFGLPVTVALIARSRTNGTWASQLKYLLTNGAMWSIGYVGAWVAKILATEIFLPGGVLVEFGHKVLYRMGVEGEKISLGKMLGSNVRHMFPLFYLSGEPVDGVVPANSAAVALAVLCAAIALVLAIASSPSRDHMRRTATVLLVVPLPYLWYLLAANHSSVHHFFTYRTQTIAAFALLYFVLSVIDGTQLRRRYTGAWSAMRGRSST